MQLLALGPMILPIQGLTLGLEEEFTRMLLCFRRSVSHLADFDFGKLQISLLANS